MLNQALIVSGCLLSIAIGFAASQPPATTHEQIRSASGARREALSIVRVRMEYKETIPKGAYSKQLPPALAQGDDQQPPVETINGGTCTLAFKGSKGRVSRENMVWHVSQKRFNKGRTDSIIDSKQFKSLVKYGGQEWPTGRISNEGWTTESDMILWPLLLALRGDDKNVLGSAVLDGTEAIRTIVGQGRSLVEVTRNRDEQRGDRKLLLDLAQDYCPTRFESYGRGGDLVSRAAVVQTRSAKSTWIPTKWVVSDFSGTSLLRHVEVSVTQLDLDNIADSDLELDFPVGTYVTDASKAKREEYIIKESTKRVVLPEERNAGYQRLFMSETGDFRTQSSKMPLWGWILSSIGAIAILIACIWTYRTWKPRQSPSSDSSTPQENVGGIS